MTQITLEPTQPANGNALAIMSPDLIAREQEVAIREREFALQQRQAKVYADSDLVPQHYRGKIGNVLIAQNMAKRMNGDLLMIMQNLYVVHGNPGWSSQYLIASFNANGRFSAIKYRFSGEGDDYGCSAYCTEIATGEEISGTKITMAMAKAEGWVNKNGSKWKTMPEQMFRYRSAAFLIRATAPEIAMGLLTKEELEDIHDGVNGNGSAIAEKTRGRVEDLKQKLAPAHDDKTAEGDIIDAEPVISDIPTEPPADTDADAEASQAEADAVETDPLDSLRADAMAMFDELPKSRQKDLIAGKATIAGRPKFNSMTEEEIHKWVEDMSVE